MLPLGVSCMYMERSSHTEQRVYLDYAATTPVSPRVANAMQPFFSERFGNPRSQHAFGKSAREAFDDARFRVGTMLDVTADEIYFTSGGTDANERAILGVINALQDEGTQLSEMHIIVSAIEHTSVLQCAEMLSRRGVAVSYVPVTDEGLVEVRAVADAVRDTTVLVSVMLVNNEIGTIQPIKEIARALADKSVGRKHAIVFHTDACQAPLWLSVRPRDLGVHLLSLDGHKMYGPKGVGALLVLHGTPFAGITGALHQKKKSNDGVDGTPNMPGIVGFAEALTICEERREAKVKEITELREYCMSCIADRFADARIHGSRTHRVANNVSVSFPNVEGEYVVAQLSHGGVAASAKSACLSGGEEGSYVIAALDPERKNGAVRFTLGYETTREDIEYAVSVLVDAVS